jgi:hypothetical protein
MLADRRRNRIEGRCRGTVVRRAGASISTAPMRAKGSRKLPSRSATSSGRPNTRPHACHSATISSVVSEENSGRQRRVALLEHDVDRAWRLVVSLSEPDHNTAEGRDRQIERHAHAADAAANHDALAA